MAETATPAGSPTPDPLTRAIRFLPMAKARGFLGSTT